MLITKPLDPTNNYDWLYMYAIKNIDVYKLKELADELKIITHRLTDNPDNKKRKDIMENTIYSLPVCCVGIICEYLNEGLIQKINWPLPGGDEAEGLKIFEPNNKSLLE